jgi:hypothetical protein
MANVLNPATADLPMRHAFVHGNSGDPKTDWIRLPMGDFVEFITNSEELCCCTRLFYLQFQLGLFR